MESSFFEYRDETGVDSDSEDEVIDDSLVEPKEPPKTKTNHTVFVPESDESSSEDGSRRSSPRISHNEIVVSSSEEEDEQYSPEMVPRRPASAQKPQPRVAGIKNKRLQLDSDLDNSITTANNRHRKQKCLKDTPLKIVQMKSNVDDSMRDASYLSNSDSDNEIDDGNDETKCESDDEPLTLITSKTHVSKDSPEVSKKTRSLPDDSDSEVQSTKNESIIFSARKLKNCRRIVSDDSSDTDDENTKASKGVDDESVNDKSVDKSNESSEQGSKVSLESDLDGPDEYELAVSRATRKSIMGFIPKDNESDESDFIQSDDSHRKSATSDVPNSTSEIQDTSSHSNVVELPKTPERDADSSRLTCSPIRSPLHDVTNENIESVDDSPIPKEVNKPHVFVDPKVQSVKEVENKENYIRYDDDVTIVDTKPEIIQLSSDDEDDASVENKFANTKKSPNIKNETNKLDNRPKDNTIKSYLVPPSYPNQGVVYVKKSVRENELSKLNGLKEDLHNVKRLLQQVEVNTLPDGGVKLIERLSGLEAEIRRQGDKVANMVVEPDNPTPEQMVKDGFEKGLSWEEIQKASNAVQPRMFGKQAMASHMAERNLILDRLRDLHESLDSRPPDTQLAPPPRALSSALMPHQLHALAWLHWRETQRPAAGILADDMGLGKTITMIALVVSDKEKNIDDDDDDDLPRNSRLVRGGTLVVCPASLVQQWAAEVEKHCLPGRVSVSLHHGPSRTQHAHRLAASDIIVTTYNILQRDHDKGVLFRVRWRRVILDEAHTVRNHKSATCRAAAALHAARRWALSGTPVHNKDLDLFALLQFLRCSPFDELSMWKKWIDNKSLGGQERLSTIMRCILLRRTKLQLQQKGQLDCLPDRHTHEQHVTLTKNEMNVYQKVLVFSKTLFAQFLHQRAEKNSELSSVPPDKDSEYAKMHKRMIALQGVKPVKSHEILVLLLRLRQVCCHCGLIAAMLDDGGDVGDEDAGGKDLLDELNKLTLEDNRRQSKNPQENEEEAPQEEGTTAAEAIRSVLSPNNPVFELTRPSSKINAVMECLQENVFSKPGEKAVIVSQWTSVLHLVEKQLSALKVRCVTLSGAVPVAARPALVQAINDHNSTVKVMLLSLCAGGVGLNLCGANHLFLLDPHWNPQLEQQAQDRVYRVGQNRTVHVYRFMCLDTVEQTIRKLQEAKLELADNVLTGARNTNASKLTIEDLKMLFNMGPPGT